MGHRRLGLLARDFARDGVPVRMLEESSTFADPPRSNRAAVAPSAALQSRQPRWSPATTVEARLEEALKAAHVATCVATAAHEARVAAEASLESMRSEREAATRRMEDLEVARGEAQLAVREMSMSVDATAALKGGRSKKLTGEDGNRTTGSDAPVGVSVAPGQAEEAAVGEGALNQSRPLMSHHGVHVKARSQDNPDYPQRLVVSTEAIDWATQWSDYSPEDWTHPVVFANSRDLSTGKQWADPPDPLSIREELQVKVGWGGVEVRRGCGGGDVEMRWRCGRGRVRLGWGCCEDGMEVRWRLGEAARWGWMRYALQARRALTGIALGVDSFLLLGTHDVRARR